MTAAGAARPGWARTAAASLVVGLATAGSIFAGMVALAPAARAADDTSSAVTVTAAQQDPDLADAPFPDLSVTVSQTKSLMSQGITLTYSGGTRSTSPSNQVAGANFLQVFQCWGNLEDAQGNLILDQQGRPQPDRTTCQYGSTGNAGQSRTSTKSSLDAVSSQDEQYLYPGAGYFDPPWVAIPFRSVTGKTLASVIDGTVVPGAVDLDNNEFFTRQTTNEVPWTGFGSDGAGTTTFEVQTNMQAPGLGCGNPVTGAGGAITGQPCWLVIVPRGTHDLGEQYVTKSALLWETWEHRLAVPLDFRPLGVRCSLGAAERSTAGSELLALAVASWQPALCARTGGSIYNLIVANEADVAEQANGTDSAPLALTSRALSDPGGPDNLVYAPVAVTGLAVVFAVDHNSDPIDPAVPDDVRDRDMQPFTQMNLTPRLLAKLLTNSYTASLPRYADTSHLGTNPANITVDPDFLTINPGWADQSLRSASLADLLVPLGRSDSAWAVWSYVLADPEARAFLDGTPDPWGMVVNPWASTSPTVNPVGSGAEYPVDSFPKVDPVDVDLIKDEYGRSDINVVTWRPYAPDFDTAGYWVLRGDGRLLGDWDPLAVPPKFGTIGRSLPGQQKVLGLTDTASAAKYQVFTAALRNPAGQFVVPTTTSMTAAAAAMTPDAGQTQVERFDAASEQAKAATDAYPLTVPVYAATNPDGGDGPSRDAFAAFIRYAADAGQQPGTDIGQLPPGYAPLPAAWRVQADEVAQRISAGPAGPTPTPTATATPTATPTEPPPTSDLPELPDTGLPPQSGGPAGPTSPPSESPSPAGPTPTPTPSATGPAVVVGAATPADRSAGPLGAAVPISAAGGLLAAACVPLVARPRRAP